jgi:hypothetical protein
MHVGDLIDDERLIAHKNNVDQILSIHLRTRFLEDRLAWGH